MRSAVADIQSFNKAVAYKVSSPRSLLARNSRSTLIIWADYNEIVSFHRGPRVPDD